MSLPWRNELRLNLRQRHCEAALAVGPWPLRAVRRVRAQGTAPETMLTQAVEALRAQAKPPGRNRCPAWRG